jgi:hypothetical protein
LARAAQPRAAAVHWFGLVFRRAGLGLPLGRFRPGSASDSGGRCAARGNAWATCRLAPARRASVLLQSRIRCRRLDPISGPRRPASRRAGARAPPRKGSESSCCCGLCRDGSRRQRVDDTGRMEMGMGFVVTWPAPARVELERGDRVGRTQEGPAGRRAIHPSVVVGRSLGQFINHHHEHARMDTHYALLTDRRCDPYARPLLHIHPSSRILHFFRLQQRCQFVTAAGNILRITEYGSFYSLRPKTKYNSLFSGVKQFKYHQNHIQNTNTRGTRYKC